MLHSIRAALGALLALAGAIVPAAATAQETVHDALRGHVREPDGAPVRDAAVSVAPSGAAADAPPYVVRTDAAGYWSVRVLAGAPSYDVVVHAAGMAPTWACATRPAVDTATATAGASIVVDVVLSRGGASPASRSSEPPLTGAAAQEQPLMRNQSRLAVGAAMCAAQLALTTAPTPDTTPESTPETEQGVAQSGEFVIRQGSDTIAVERFTRDGATLGGHIAQRSGVETDYTVTLRRDGTAEHVELSRGGLLAGSSMSVALAPSRVRATITAGDESDSIAVETPARPVPFLAVSFALAEQIVRASRLAPGGSARWLAVRLAARDTATVTARRFHPDSVTLTMRDLELRLAVSRAGDVVGGRRVAQGWTVERRDVAAR